MKNKIQFPVPFLDQIKAQIPERIARAMITQPLEILKNQIDSMPVPRNFVSCFFSQKTEPPRIIAEVKRQSPSLGDIALELDPVEVALGYARAGAAAISVLTEPKFFGGSLSDLAQIREALPVMPLLLKDFVMTEYQLFEARSMGADAVLLMHSLLSRDELDFLIRKTVELKLTPLVEVRNERELFSALELGALCIGVNNRNLETMQINLETSRGLIGSLSLAQREGLTLIAESGIYNHAQINELSELGFNAFLVGTSLMRDKQPEQALRRLLRDSNRADESNRTNESNKFSGNQ
jgi:indole-3-glycerol phosphate synthase